MESVQRMAGALSRSEQAGVQGYKAQQLSAPPHVPSHHWGQEDNEELGEWSGPSGLEIKDSGAL